MARGLVTVFGGSGFIGRYVVQRLARAGWQVRVAVRRPNEALFLKTSGDVGQVTPIAANIRDDRSVAAAVAGADAVVNLVGILYQSGRQSFDSVQAKGPARVAAAAKAAGATRFIQISAIGADSKSDALYARSKAAGEQAVNLAFPGATILRPSIVFGAEDDFFNRFARMAMMSPALPLIGGGHTRFQPVFVGDVATAVETALQDAGTAGKTYELAGPRVYTFRALMELLLKEIGRCRLLLPLPFALASLNATFLQLLPIPPLTVDQVRLLKRDNVATANTPGLPDLGITPTTLESVLPSYLDQYRPLGFYNKA
ncbi:complex I NDUFA9 subunit family protein [Dongia rigui]|uniref:Complex I NDUFA9 subunit family protein n=1 Tax=Dongia rigui TaxID=940149 RepID=A0ABU5DYC1_9PROT|nr:complex I NDUFA9 subunit family protein [Dongia rigui]MDY0872276.1 complex I NDUFA9 subunit family protein [Dongia rigui]